MNPLNEHGNIFPLCFVSKRSTTEGLKIARNDLANRNVIAPCDFNNTEIAGFDLDNEKAAARINEDNGAVHRVTSNVLGEGPPERRSRVGDREAQLLGGPSRPAG